MSLKILSAAAAALALSAALQPPQALAQDILTQPAPGAALEGARARHVRRSAL